MSKPRRLRGYEITDSTLGAVLRGGLMRNCGVPRDAILINVEHKWGSSAVVFTYEYDGFEAHADYPIVRVGLEEG